MGTYKSIGSKDIGHFSRLEESSDSEKEFILFI